MSLALPGGPSAPKVPLVTTASSGNLPSGATSSHFFGPRFTSRARDQSPRAHSSIILKVSHEEIRRGSVRSPERSKLRLSTDSATDHGLHDLDAFWKNEADVVNQLGRSGSLQIYGHARNRPNMPEEEETSFESLQTLSMGLSTARIDGESSHTGHKRSQSDVSLLLLAESRQINKQSRRLDNLRFCLEETVLEVDTTSTTSEDDVPSGSTGRTTPTVATSLEEESCHETASSSPCERGSAGSVPSRALATMVYVIAPFEAQEEEGGRAGQPDYDDLSVRAAHLATTDAVHGLSSERNDAVEDVAPGQVSHTNASPPGSPRDTSAPPTIKLPTLPAGLISPSAPLSSHSPTSTPPPRWPATSHRASIHLSGLFDRSSELDLHSPNPNPTSIRADFSSFLKSGNIDTSGAAQDSVALMTDSDADYPATRDSNRDTLRDDELADDEDDAPLFDVDEWKRSTLADSHTVDSHGLTFARNLTLKQLQDQHGNAIDVFSAPSVTFKEISDTSPRSSNTDSFVPASSGKSEGIDDEFTKHTPKSLDDDFPEGNHRSRSTSASTTSTTSTRHNMSATGGRTLTHSRFSTHASAHTSTSPVEALRHSFQGSSRASISITSSSTGSGSKTVHISRRFRSSEMDDPIDYLPSLKSQSSVGSSEKHIKHRRRTSSSSSADERRKPQLASPIRSHVRRLDSPNLQHLPRRIQSDHPMATSTTSIPSVVTPAPIPLQASTVTSRHSVSTEIDSSGEITIVPASPKRVSIDTTRAERTLQVHRSAPTNCHPLSISAANFPTNSDQLHPDRERGTRLLRHSAGRASSQKFQSQNTQPDPLGRVGVQRSWLSPVPRIQSDSPYDASISQCTSSRFGSSEFDFPDYNSESSEEDPSPFVQLDKDGRRPLVPPDGSIPDLDVLGSTPGYEYPMEDLSSPEGIEAVLNSLVGSKPVTESDLSRHRRKPSQTKIERRLREIERRLDLLEKYHSMGSEHAAAGRTHHVCDDGYTSLHTSAVYAPTSSPTTLRRGRSSMESGPPSIQSTESAAQTPTQTPRDAPNSRTSSTFVPNDNAYNRRFQEIMKLSGPIKYIQMSALGRDFVQLAEVYGRIIISERCLPPEQKSIKPVALGGQAGGSKFMVQGILFKYAMDVKLASGPGRKKWLYGGKKRDDGAAMKAAGNELLGLSSFVRCNSTNTIHFPVMALIDYCGFRLVAVSTLPINSETIVYGSADAGRTVHNKDEVAIRAMQEFGHDLNLREHMVFDKPIMGPGDLEVHRGHDGNLYMIDFARTFPPEAPGEDAHPQSIFYKVLRPELVRSNEKPLSSDAFSGWQSSDSKSQSMNEDVENATKRLLESVIPGYPQIFLAPDFQTLFRSEVCNISDLHRRGINLRHLGRVRAEMFKVCVDNDSLYLVEMICRTLKSYIAMRFRALMDDLIIFAEEPFRNEALMLFNLVAQPSTSADFWHVRVKSLIQRKYGPSALRAEELDEQVMLLNVLPKEHRLYLVRRLAWHLCVIFDDNIWDNFQDALNANAEFEFFPQDIKEIKPRIKYMTILDLALGITLYMQAAGAVDASRNEANILLLQEAKICLVNAWTRISDCLVTRYFLAKVWYLMGKLKSDGADDFARALVMIESTMVEERDRADLKLDYAKAGVMAFINGRESARFDLALEHYREITKTHPPMALTLRNDVLAWMANQHGNKAVDSVQLENRITSTHTVMRLLLPDQAEYDAFLERLNNITSKPRNWQAPLSRSSFSGRMFTS